MKRWSTKVMLGRTVKIRLQGMSKENKGEYEKLRKTFQQTAIIN